MPVLKYEAAKPSDDKVKRKCKDAEDQEVTQYIPPYHDGDPKENLIRVYVQEISETYDLSLNGTHQLMRRCLDGTARDKYMNVK